MKDTDMTDLLENGSRAELLAYCAWNDPNGVWTDEQCASEGYEPATVEDLRAIIQAWVDEG
jgi:hypothetical protein